MEILVEIIRSGAEYPNNHSLDKDFGEVAKYYDLKNYPAEIVKYNFIADHDHACEIYNNLTSAILSKTGYDHFNLRPTFVIVTYKFPIDVMKDFGSREDFYKYYLKQRNVFYCAININGVVSIHTGHTKPVYFITEEENVIHLLSHPRGEPALTCYSTLNQHDSRLTIKLSRDIKKVYEENKFLNMKDASCLATWKSRLDEAPNLTAFEFLMSFRAKKLVRPLNPEGFMWMPKIDPPPMFSELDSSPADKTAPPYDEAISSSAVREKCDYLTKENKYLQEKCDKIYAAYLELIEQFNAVLTIKIKPREF